MLRCSENEGLTVKIYKFPDFYFDQNSINSSTHAYILHADNNSQLGLLGESHLNIS